MSPSVSSHNIKSRKISRSKKEKKDVKKNILKELEKDCREMSDQVLLEDFADMSAKELRDIVKIGKGVKKNCYKAETLFNVIRNAADENIPAKDPLSNVRLTKEEIKAVMTKYRKGKRGITTPQAITNLNPFSYLLAEPLQNNPTYSTLFYVHPTQPPKNLGVIPTDNRLIGKLEELYQAGRLLVLGQEGVYRSPRIHLHKKLEYWLPNREFLINKMIDEIDQLI
jgi:hypothetical protein